MTAAREMDWQRSLDGLLRLVVALEVPVYFGAAWLHTGARIPLGPLVLAVPNPIPAATVVETILGLAAVMNLVALMRTTYSSERMTIGIHLFLLAGVSLGMVALALRVGPPPGPDWTIHYIMLAGIAAAMVLVLLRREPKRE